MGKSSEKGAATAQQCEELVRKVTLLRAEGVRVVAGRLLQPHSAIVALPSIRQLTADDMSDEALNAPLTA